MRNGLLLFTKPALAGRVKTRLIGPGLDAAAVARLHAAFVVDLVERMADGDFEVVPAWALAENEPIPNRPAGGIRQAEGDLGERLFAAMSGMAERFESVAVIGSDHPELERATVDEAFARLAAGADLVLGPAHDGGYCLIATDPRRVARGLFEGIGWSGPNVLVQTLARAHELELRTELLEPAHDIDTPADLDALVARLARRDPGFCPATRAVLLELGRLEAARLACAS